MPEASRFLSQATFGATQPGMESLTASTYGAWLTQQFSIPQSLHLPNTDAYLASDEAVTDPRQQVGFIRSMWKSFTAGPDALRQRVAFALSEIFVASLSLLSGHQRRSPSAYLDMLGRNAFGNFRTLIEDVSLSPAMGVFLSHLANEKEDPATGRTADENYAREIMQLFTIGLNQLNMDGTLKRGSDGQPIDTYTNADITGLAKVFTGFSWGALPAIEKNYPAVLGLVKNAGDREVVPMQVYPGHHSTSEKSFLGVTIPSNAAADAMSDLTIALDTLFLHANTAPFFSKQLIQRLVTSNPSPAYVGRVAAVFVNNGAGVRGDLKAVVSAVLLDDEARNFAALTPVAGKLREPVVRLIQWMRAFGATSADGRFLMGRTVSPAFLGQSPMIAPSVFNFFRPGYTPSSGKTADLNLLAPEAQITQELSVVSYVNFMTRAINVGLGDNNDIQPDFSPQLKLADDPDALVANLNLLITANQLGATTKALIRDAIASVPIATDTADRDRLNRVKIAVLMTMVAPEYLVQK
ncbi:MAG: DUF1800 domain-containing protein [Oxalobacteraceae bacterium]|nr:DUF1800 domain-containing protein [Oxalobacteraceae bacterium]